MRQSIGYFYYNKDCFYCENLLFRVKNLINIQHICVDTHPELVPRVIKKIPALYITELNKLFYNDEINNWIRSQENERGMNLG